jgi:formylglycine-generating enzyme required for sulfatase activity
MGSDNGKNHERPAHAVYLDGYYIDLYEVTNGAYALCVEAGSCKPPKLENSYSRSSYYRNPEYADYPVVYVGLQEAQSYCKWRGARLPTEAEWEKAARGGLEDREFPWGDKQPVCQYGASNGAKFIDVGCNNTDTDPVGSYSANDYGLYDMAGNVWEWVADRFAEDYYTNSPYENPAGPEFDFSSNVARGGSWANPVSYLTVYRRYPLPMTVIRYFVGFRCARSLDAKPVQPTATATPIPRKPTPTGILPTQIVDESGVSMALVPAGEFVMGSQKGRENERPLREIYLDTFYMDIYEVTNELFASFLNIVEESDTPYISWLKQNSVYVRLHQRDGKWQVDAGYENHPMTDVTLEGARAFCQWRDAFLPTEAQWEKAARGGLNGALYPWGDEAPVCTPGAENGAQVSGCDGQAMSVGSFSPNGYGIYDMAGNVWEWIDHPYKSDYYSVSPSDNPPGPKFTGTWVVRGGSWNFSEDYARCSYRYSRYLTYTSADHGFRCARWP